MRISNEKFRDDGKVASTSGAQFSSNNYMKNQNSLLSHMLDAYKMDPNYMENRISKFWTQKRKRIR